MEQAIKAELILKKLVETNEELYNWQKLAEELFELGEVVMKTITKNGTEKQPPMEKVIEETGDVILRISILTKKLNIEEKVLDRMINKLLSFEDKYISKNKYIGRI